MCTTTGVASILAGLADLASDDVTLLPDDQVRDELLALLGAVNSLNAVVLARVATFDARGLSEVDDLRTTAGWLIRFGHQGRSSAGSIVKRSLVLRELPELSAAAASGAVSDNHLRKVVKLVDDVGNAAARDFDKILADLASTATPAQVGAACRRIRAHIRPGGPEASSRGDLPRRELRVTQRGSMMAINGRLDTEAGSALMAALDTLTPRIPGNDERTLDQRRADALADLARRALAGGWTADSRRTAKVGHPRHRRVTSPARRAPRTKEPSRGASASSRRSRRPAAGNPPGAGP